KTTTSGDISHSENVQKKDVKQTGHINPSPSSFIQGSNGQLEASQQFEQRLRLTKEIGKPLPKEIQGKMEGILGEDFSHVRIHTGYEASQLNKDIRSQAFTHGNNIYFNQGNFDPMSTVGKHLLAHELTHVIHQKGSNPLNRKVQRYEGIGNWAHKEIQERLREKDPKLITEAPIPGGTRNDKQLNLVGFADLYKSDQQIVSGIFATESSEEKHILSQKVRSLTYKNMPSPKSSKEKFSKWRKIKSKSRVKYGPKIKNKKWIFTPNFPSNFEVGELKPLIPSDFPISWASLVGTGFQQTGNYRQGFEDFVKRVHKDIGPPIPSSIKGDNLDLGERFPDEINYSKFEQERGRADRKKAILIPPDYNKRIWVYKLKDGLYVYFIIPKEWKSEEFPKEIDKQLAELDPLLKEVRKKRPTMSTNLMSKPMPGAINRSLTVGKVDSSPTKANKKMIQAKGIDWKGLAKNWEKRRHNWAKGKRPGVKTPQKFLEKDAAGIEKKTKIDKKLNLPLSSKAVFQDKNVKKIRFWSSRKGRIFGALRFRFGKVFDKVSDFFDKMKAKFRKHHTDSDKLNDKGGLFGGWKKGATKLIILFAVSIFKNMIVLAYSRFSGCIKSIISTVLNQFAREANAKLLEETQPLCCEIVDLKNEMEKKYQEHEGIISRFVYAIETIKEWGSILSDVITAIRIGVQIISCGSPPGLGCVWGLVAQLGISAGLNLLTRTDYFKDEIAKPAAQQLMNAIVGNRFHNFLIDLLASSPIGKFMGSNEACKKIKPGKGGRIGGNLNSINPNDPEIVKIRKEWEKDFKGQMIKDLQQVFETGKGKKVTEKELLQLVEAMQKSGKKPEEFKKLIEQARDPKSGKIDLGKSVSNIETGIVPSAESQVVEREIDYKKAAENNLFWQKKLGWKPFLFYKKPGIKADSIEFANGIYDAQKAFGLKADGIAGPITTRMFYRKNKLKKDASYRRSERILKERRRQREEEKKAKDSDKIKKPSSKFPDKSALIQALKTQVDWLPGIS
ncbi:MAG: DUF4157 domain-containing protein, partial [Deltaproteobacteria bacterium]|nr:DUF4157 domain-containing protein [Deltaproteobacteria bacterium]